MSPSNPPQNRLPYDERLEQRCLSYVEQEAVSLRNVLESQRLIRVALRRGHRQGLAAVTEQQVETSQVIGDINSRRTDFRNYCSAVLRTSPDSITLTYLAGCLSREAAKKLRHAQEQLRHLAREIDALNRENRVRVNHYLDFLKRFWDGVHGCDPSGPRYGPMGTQVEARRTLLEVQG